MYRSGDRAPGNWTELCSGGYYTPRPAVDRDVIVHHSAREVLLPLSLSFFAPKRKSLDLGARDERGHSRPAEEKEKEDEGRRWLDGRFFAADEFQADAQSRY